MKKLVIKYLPGGGLRVKRTTNVDNGYVYRLDDRGDIYYDNAGNKYYKYYNPDDMNDLNNGKFFKSDDIEIKDGVYTFKANAKPAENLKETFVNNPDNHQFTTNTNYSINGKISRRNMLDFAYDELYHGDGQLDYNELKNRFGWDDNEIKNFKNMTGVNKSFDLNKRKNRRILRKALNHSYASQHYQYNPADKYNPTPNNKPSNSTITYKGIFINPTKTETNEDLNIEATGGSNPSPAKKKIGGKLILKNIK